MIRDLLQQQSSTQQHAEVCIVGAGAAGITVAVLLSRAGRHVTLLEGGGATSESGTDCFKARAMQLAYRGIREGRAQGLGGTTNLWGGQILPLGDIDFKQRSWVDGSGWPLRKAELQTFYDQALGAEGLAGTIASDDAVWSRVGERRPEFPQLESYVSRWCPEPNFAKLHADALQSDRIDVWLHARAVRLQHSQERVDGVVVRTPAGAEHIFTADHFVFCLGTIECCRFFLQPGEGRSPWDRNGLIGCYFQDHIDCDAATVLPRDANALRRDFDAIHIGGQKYLPKLRLTEDAQHTHSLLNAGATLYSPAEQDTTADLRRDARALLQRKLPLRELPRAMRSFSASPAVLQQAVRFLVRHRGSLPTHKPLALRVHCEQEPSGESRIRLSSERDPYGMLRAEVHWAISDRELATVRAFTQIAAEALAPIAQVQPHPELLREGGDFRPFCQDSFHHMGGMRMSESPGSGVVDTDLRLHGVRNCFVCSAAVFPTSGFSNPTHTVLALAARLASHLVS